MNKKRIVLLFLCFFLLTPIYVEAQSKVHFLNESEQFFISPNDLDLFSNFKNLVPGGEYSQTIELFNQDDEAVNLYLRRYEISQEYEEMLSKMYMEAYLDDELILETEAHTVEDFKERSFIARLEPQEKHDLVLNLKIDPSMGNEFQESIAILDWEFYVEKDEKGVGDRHNPEEELGTSKEDKVTQEEKNELKSEKDQGLGILPSTGKGSLLKLAIGIITLGVILFLINKEK